VIIIQLSFITENIKKYLKTTIKIYLIIIIASIVSYNIVGLNEYLQLFMINLKKEIGQFDDYKFIGIFINNSKACLVTIIAGLILGKLGYFMFLYHGFYIGGIVKVTSLTVTQCISLMIVHGITELFALSLAGAIGISYAIKYNGYTKNKSVIKKIVIDCMILYLLIVVPLVLISAFLEAYVSHNIALFLLK
jgi:stage II sporulation protein M